MGQVLMGALGSDPPPAQFLGVVLLWNERYSGVAAFSKLVLAITIFMLLQGGKGH